MKDYQILDKSQTGELAKFLAESGQLLFPMVELIETAQIAVDDLLERLGQATLEAVLAISARNVAGESHQGKRGGDILRHGSQQGVIPLCNRKVRVRHPRLRHRSGGEGAEIEIPAYQAMREDRRLPAKMLDTLMRCVSTRNYAKILPDTCEAVGVSKSSVSREFIEASEATYKSLLERRFDDLDILVIYIDGLVFAEHHILAAVGIDAQGYKHVLGIQQGASENATAVKALLEHLVERGIRADAKYLYVIDGSKALRQGIDAIFGSNNPIQRCRLHKERNVCDHLPQEQRAYALTVLRAAFRLEADEGKKRLEELAVNYEKRYPSASASIREGLDEMFTVACIGVPGALSRCLVSTNLIESPNSGVRMRTNRVTRWKDGVMVQRWAATAFLATEKQFRRVSGYQHLWMIAAALGRKADQNQAKAA